MKLSPLRWGLIAIGAFLLVTVLGGSAIWQLGGVHALDINGRAPVVEGAEARTGDGWPAYGGDAGGARYSRAAEITPANVAELTQAWEFHTGAFEGRESARERSAFEATPILVENSLIFCTQFNDVIALDPGTGAERWRHREEVGLDRRPGNQYTCRGVSYWRDERAAADAPCASRLFMGTVDARLVALDARTGAACAGFGQNGAVTIAPSVALRWPGEFQITSAPAVIGETVIVGTSISDNLRTDAPLGVVFAFNARTGALQWSFNPVPRAPDDPARASWGGNSADHVGHANVWSTISVDHERGLVFLPTSSPSPDFFGGGRAGDNRYADSVVALNAATGRVVWHFQTVHHDVWDYDLPAQPGLYTVWRDGRAHDVVAQVTKTGLVFVLDRDTGEPFLPVTERPVPQGGVEGEALSPTQPFPATPPIVPDRVEPGEAFGVTLWDRLACASAIDSLRREGLYTPPSLQGTLVYPFTGGGANWGSAAYDPSRNLLVVNMNNMAHEVRLYPKARDDEETAEVAEDVETAPMEGGPYSMSRRALLSPLGLPCTPPPWGVLAGVDLSTGQIVWRRAFGTTEDLAPGRLAMPLGVPGFGGPIVTAGGLIFIGAAMDDYLRAFDVETGAELWKGRLPAGGQATPMTYVWEGRQYVVIAAGGHARAGTRLGDSVVAFALPRPSSP
jgi:quinoprotein glucose dehydrogenase